LADRAVVWANAVTARTIATDRTANMRFIKSLLDVKTEVNAWHTDTKAAAASAIGTSGVV
jgi:hypothetical protein